MNLLSRLSSDIIVLFPGFLEALTRRGGGREKRLLEIALRLSKYYKIIIIAPFFAKYYKIIKINPRLIINNLYFPSVKDYPPKSNFTKIMQLISIFFYIFEATIKIIQLKDKRLKILVVSDVTSILPAIVAKLLKLKVLYYEGNTELWDGHEKNIIQKFYQAFYIFLGSLLGKMSDALIVNDGIIKGRMIDKGIEKCKIFIVRGATDTNKFKLLQLKNSIKRKEDGSLIVGFIGRLTKEKGVALLLEMCRKTRIKLPNVKYIILGDGPYREEIKQLPNVIFVGQVEHDAIPVLLSSIDVVISFQKSFGLGEIEALSCGKPIIAGKIGEIPKLVKDGVTGLLCEPKVDSYIKTLSKIINEKELLKKLSENARLEAIKFYDWKIKCEEWKTIINQIFERRCHGKEI